jgi:hypothetical protein
MDEDEEQPISIGWTDAQPSRRNSHWVGGRLEFLIFETETFAFGTPLPYYDRFCLVEANNSVSWFLHTVQQQTHRYPERILAGLQSGPVSATIRDFLANPRRHDTEIIDLTYADSSDDSDDDRRVVRPRRNVLWNSAGCAFMERP